MRQNLKRVNISLDQNLANNFDEFAKKSGITKSILIKNFINAYDGHLVPSITSSKSKITTYNFKIDEDLYKFLQNLANEHLISISGVLRLIILKNINEKSLPSIYDDKKYQQNLEDFKEINQKLQDLDKTMGLLKKYTQLKRHRGFNFSSIKTFKLRKDIERTSSKLHDIQSNLLNVFFLGESSFNYEQVKIQILEAFKYLNRYELSIQYYETAIEYYDLQNPFYKNTKPKFTSYNESVMKASLGNFEITEYLCDLKSTSLIKIGEFSYKLMESNKEFKIMSIGPGALIGTMYSLIGLANEMPKDLKKDFKAIFDIYDACFPENTGTNNDKFFKEKIINIRTVNGIMSINLIDLIKTLGFSEENLVWNFYPINLVGPKGTYLEIHNLVADILQKQTYDINWIYSTESMTNFPAAYSLIKKHSNKGVIIGTSHIVFCGDYSPKIYNENGKRSEHKLFSVALKKIHHFQLQTNMDECWLPIVMRPDLSFELDDLFNSEDEVLLNRYKTRINNKGLYFENTPMETHVLLNPLGCITIGIHKTKLLMRKEGMSEKDKTVDYQCSVAVTKV